MNKATRERLTCHENERALNETLKVRRHDMTRASDCNISSHRIKAPGVVIEIVMQSFISCSSMHGLLSPTLQRLHVCRL